MGKQTEISWTKSTFNPWIGCTKISPGCDNCYAEAADARWHHGKHWGTGAPRYRTNANYWRAALRWNEEARHLQGGTFWPVFCASQADVLDNEVDQAWRDDLWALIRDTPFLTWLLVTKRIGNAFKMLPQAWLEGGLPANIWMLSTIVTQAEYDRDVKVLRQVPASVRGISMEPMLERIRFDANLIEGAAIHWTIFGFESRQKGQCRGGALEWIIDGLTQCRYYGITPFVKQLGSILTLGGNIIPLLPGDNFKRSKVDVWPPELRTQEYPGGLRIAA